MLDIYSENDRINKLHYFFAILLVFFAVLISENSINKLPVFIILICINIIISSNHKFNIIFFFIYSVLFIFPQLDRYHILPVIDDNIGITLLVLSATALLFKFKFNSSFNKYWLFFLVILISQTISGKIQGHHSEFIKNEFIKYLFYPLGFYFTLLVLKKRDINNFIQKLMIFFLILGVIITTQMLVYYFTSTHGARVLTRQANLLLISLLTSLTLILFKKDNNLNMKIIQILGSVYYLIGILIFMQRSLWIGALGSVLTLFLLFLIKSKNKIRVALIFFLLFALLGTSVFFIFDKFGINNENLTERTEDMEEQGIQTFSVAVRLLSYLEIFKKIRNNWLFGLGVGDDIVTTYLNLPVINIVDNSYIVILWKFGLVGLSVFVMIFLKSFSQMYYIIRHTRNNLITMFTIIIFTNFIGQMINGLACVIMILYFYNFIWASNLAIIDKLYLYEKSHENI